MARYGLGERGAADVPLEERAKSLRAALEELGPTFAKLGQILSTRPDLLPPEFIAELSKLQDDVPPMTEEEVVAVMEEELRVPWEDVFESIDPEPLAAGTIGQVHAATLEGGDRVVVKVQRHGRGGRDHARPRPARALRGEGGAPPTACDGSSTSPRSFATSPSR